MELIYHEKDGLNGLGFSFKKLGRSIKKNVRLKNISVKTAIKAATMPTHFIPGIGPIVEASMKATQGLLKGNVKQAFKEVKNGVIRSAISGATAGISNTHAFLPKKLVPKQIRKYR